MQSDPVGLEGGINTYAYVHSRPTLSVDPLGLWTFNLSLYAGPGGGVKVSYLNGTLEILGRLGVGLGVNLELEPGGRPSPLSEECGYGYIANSSLNLDASFGQGPFRIGAGLELGTGNAITDKIGGDYFDVSGPVISASENSFGGGIGGSLGVNIGSYSNW